MKIEGRTYDAVSVGEAINAGDSVLVVRTEGNHIVVRKASGEQVNLASGEDDVLSQPIDALGLEPFEEDPLA